MFGRNKGAKQTAEAAALMAEVQAGQFEPPSGGVSQGVSYGGEGDPNPMAGLGLGGQTNVEVFGNASPEQLQAALAKAQEVLGRMAANGNQPPPGLAHLADPGTLAQLQQLASQHAQGGISAEELAELKRHLLAGQ